MTFHLFALLLAPRPDDVDRYRHRAFSNLMAAGMATSAQIRSCIPPFGLSILWEYKMTGVSDRGFALDARDGKLLWRRYLGGQTAGAPITWSVAGRQYVTVLNGHGVFTFALASE